MHKGAVFSVLIARDQSRCWSVGKEGSIFAFDFEEESDEKSDQLWKGGRMVFQDDNKATKNCMSDDGLSEIVLLNKIELEILRDN